MNDQVKNYFKTRRLHISRELFRENHCITVQPEGPYLYLIGEGAGEGVKIPITDEDKKFVHRVQYLFRKQGNPQDSLPPGWRILATKYALLHPEPLHNYISKWDNAENRLKIYESRRIGKSSRSNDHHVANVGPEMYEFYAKANNKIFNAKNSQIEGMPPGRQSDEIVAKWWMEENKNCLHSYGEGLPSPQVKIVMRGQSRVTLAFRASTKEKFGTKWKYQWYTVKDIPVDMNSFRSHVDSHGFDQLLHAGHILRMSPTKWQSMIEPEFKGKGGKTPNEALTKANVAGYDIAHPKLKSMDIRPVKPWTLAQVKDLIDKKNPELQLDLNDEGKGSAIYQGKKIASIYSPGYITPGHQEQDRDSSNEFGKQYSEDKHFRTIIDNQIRGSVVAHLKRTGLTDFISKQETMEELFNATFDRFIGRTSRVPDQDWANWKELIGNPDGWECDKRNADSNTPFANTLCRLIGGSARTEIGHHFGMGKVGGGKTMIAAGQGGDQEDAGGRERGVTDTSLQHAGEGDELQAIKTPQELVDYIQSDMTSIRNPDVQAKIRQMAPGHPILMHVAQGLDKIHNQPIAAHQNQNDFDDDYDDEDESSIKKYNPPGVHREQALPYSFHNYLQKRLNEMGVVWGNDKASAKRLKPHQTLKGGIQVFGAPWTAGGGRPNNKDNDIKIKG